MKRVLIVGMFWFAAALVGSAADSSSAKPTVDSLAWLTGGWILERNGRLVHELWMPPAGGTMLGMSRTVANGRTTEYEFLLLRQGEDGEIYYVAKPAKQPEAAFKLVKLTANEVVFENAGHDFPQRILYTKKEDGMLLAAIEGTKDGKTRRVEYPYRPAK